MGTFAGHVLPGTFFILAGLWWAYVTSIRYILSKKRSPHHHRRVGFRSTVTMPFIVGPTHRLRRMPIESIVKGTFAFVGLLGEVITGFHTIRPQVINYGAGTVHKGGHNPHAHHDMHRRDLHEAMETAPTLTEATPTTTTTTATVNEPITVYWFSWYLISTNQQHVTMYSAFMLGSLVEILKHYRVDVPRNLDKVCGVIAFGVEGFLFFFHLHSRAPLDIHLHQLLVWAITGCVLCTALEIYDDTQILFTYGRILFTIMQGTWFYEVAWILYPPVAGPAFQWDHYSHEQIMLVTMTFCWHLMLIFVGLLVHLHVMKRMYRSSKRLRTAWNELVDIDAELDRDSAETDDELCLNGVERRSNSNSNNNNNHNHNHNHNHNSGNNSNFQYKNLSQMETTQFLNGMHSDNDDNEDEERIEFDKIDKRGSSEHHSSPSSGISI